MHMQISKRSKKNEEMRADGQQKKNEKIKKKHTWRGDFLLVHNMRVIIWTGLIMDSKEKKVTGNQSTANPASFHPRTIFNKFGLNSSDITREFTALTILLI